jgi:hypothetical protein
MTNEQCRIHRSLITTCLWYACSGLRSVELTLAGRTIQFEIVT